MVPAMGLQHYLIFASLFVGASAQYYAFYAFRNATGSIAEGATFVFNQRDFEFPTGTNHYDPARGVFTCPQPGLYYFHFSIRSASLAVSGGSLMHGETVVASAYTKSAGLDSASKGAAIECNTGEEVFVRATAGTPDVSSQYNTFTGYKVIYPA